MAIFTAGCIPQTSKAREIRDNVYKLAKHDLDSSAMKISVRKSPTCINFIAFLPKDSIEKENILKKVSECEEDSVIIFELDYKKVAVVCKDKKIIDYILDKPEEFAKDRGLKTVFVDNAKGVKLVSFNLDSDARETKAGFLSLGFTAILTSAIFFSGYQYMLDIKVNKAKQLTLVKQYKNIIKKEFSKTKNITKKVDIVSMLEKVETLTKQTNSTLQQIKYDEGSFCVEVKTPQINTLLAMLPKNISIKQSDLKKDIVQYCYEKI